MVMSKERKEFVTVRAEFLRDLCWYVQELLLCVDPLLKSRPQSSNELMLERWHCRAEDQLSELLNAYPELKNREEE